MTIFWQQIASKSHTFLSVFQIFKGLHFKSAAMDDFNLETNKFTRKALILYNQLLSSPHSFPIISREKTHQKKQPVVVKQIIDNAHPAFGQRGLFAAKTISPEEFIINYTGLVHVEDESDPNSDYDIRFITLGKNHEHLSIDASKQGSKARFINDFRGVGERPNVEFREYFDGYNFHLGVFAMKGKKPVVKGAELLVTYGKGFWDARRRTNSDET